MKKQLLYPLLVTFLLMFKSYGQIAILGPTFVKTYTPTTAQGCWVDDPLSNSGKIWLMPGINGVTLIYEYANMANLLSNVISQTYTLPPGFGWAGTGHVIYGGNLYYNKWNSGNIVKYNLATQTVLLDVPLVGAGFMNTYFYQWGGFTDIDFAVDENGLYVIYSTAANAGNIVISKMNPNTLNPLATYTTSTSKNCADAFMAQGVNYSLASYININTSLNYKYNTLTGTGIATAISFTNGSTYNSDLVYNPTTKIIYTWNNSNLYSYTVVPTNSITSGVTNTAMCAGGTISVSYTAAGTYSAPNNYTAELSDVAGSFTNAPTNIGMVTSTVSGVITATIPLGTPTGTAYKIRVSSNNPGIVGENNGINLSISNSPTVSIAASNSAICQGSSVTFTASGANTYSWDNGALTATIAVSPSITTTYTTIGTNSLACSATKTISVLVNAAPSISITGANTICVGESATLTAGGANTYSWNTGAATSGIIVSPTITTSYTSTGTNSLTGCVGSNSASIVVSPCTGIDQLGVQGLELKVYPNPGNGEYFVELKNGLNKSIKIIDIVGRTVSEFNSPNDKIKININDCANGVYYLKIRSNNAEFVTRLLKQ